MRILHFYKASLPSEYGGVPSFIDTLCKKTAKLGCENEVLSLTKNPLSEPIALKGYNVHQLKANFSLASTPIALSAFKNLKAKFIIIYIPY